MPFVKDHRGFTLMEMLIVIAIIAVLVAIAIPVLGAQFARAQAATDEANIRDGYASYQVMQLQDSSWSKDATYWLKADGTVAPEGTSGALPNGVYECKGNSKDADGAVSEMADVAGNKVKWVTGAHIKYVFDNNTVEITADKIE